MANWIITDSVNLRHPTVNTQGTAAEVLMLPLDNKAHTWQVVVRDGYVDADLSGKSCYAYFARKDNTKVLVNGTITGNVCSVTLDSTCYALPGFLRAVMIMSATDQTVAICEKTFRVNPALPGQTVDPGEVLPSIDDLLAEIGAMRLATAEANSAANAAQTATTAANTAAQAANTKANAAQAAANDAYQAATAATAATNAAQTATDDANEAAQNANEAASTITTQIDRLDRMDGNQNARLSNIESVTEGFLYDDTQDRVTAYSKTVPDNTLPFANLDMIGGKTLVWNQHTDFENRVDTGYPAYNFKFNVPFVKGHKYYCSVEIGGRGTDWNDIFQYCSFGFWTTDLTKFLRNLVSNVPSGRFVNIISYNDLPSGVENETDLSTFVFQVAGFSGSGSDIKIWAEKGMVFDITVMFGAGNEPTAEQFEAMFPADYYPYSEPTLMSFSADKVVSKGRNLIDAWETGTISEGTNATNPNTIRTTNYIPVKPNGTYFLYSTEAMYVAQYDASKNYIRQNGFNAKQAYVLQNDVYYVRLHTLTTYGGAFKGDISFYAGDANLGYIPYSESITDLSALVQKYFPDGMKSAGTVHDSFEKDDAGKWWAVQRVGSTNSFLSVSVGGVGTQNERALINHPSDMRVNYGVNEMPNVMVNRGNVGTWNQLYIHEKDDLFAVSSYGSIGLWSSQAGGTIDGYMDYLSGVTLYYELANYIRTEVTDSFPYSINVETGGTITFVNDQGVDYRMPLPNAETWKFNLGSDVVRYDTEQTLTDEQKITARNNIGAADKDEVDDLQARVTTIETMNGLHRYGVTGIGLANTQLTRLYDAVGMTAQVGTDGDNSSVINNFDDVAPFNRRKCVGEWSMYEGKPVFHVNAYYGDPDYTEDGSMGDYVAVDCTPAYYLYDKVNGTLVISAHHYEGYRPFDCLMDRTTNECRPHTYLPCYALAVKDGHAVSLPGLRNEQGDYKKLFDTCKTAANDAASQAILMPIAVNFYEWAMFTVEFANTNCQNIMYGCANLRYSNDDLIVMSSATEGIIQNHQAARVVGEYVSIQPSNVDVNTYTWLASHKIVSIERCDQDGTPNTSGAYDRVTFEVLDNTRTIEAGTSYRFAARPYNTGACNTVSTPSGSPVSNANGYYPMKYRWRENVYGNQYQTVSDLMNFAVLEDGFTVANANYAAHLEWYYHRDPETLVPTNYANSAAGRDAMIAAGWELLDINTPAENYIDGWVKSRDYSHKYPDVWKPGLTVGASYGTYYAVYAYLVSSYLLRAVRLGGNWTSGSYAGFSFAYAHYAPSYGSAYYGGSLYYPQ